MLHKEVIEPLLGNMRYEEKEMNMLPNGFDLEQDKDGDWVLIPPEDVTIYSSPGEGWLVTRNFMKGRDWDSRADVTEACLAYLAEFPPTKADPGEGHLTLTGTGLTSGFVHQTPTP